MASRQITAPNTFLRYSVIATTLISVILNLGLLKRAIAAPDSINVLVILVDDLGWTDLGCFGSDLYQTPQIDQLAREGMKFTQAYAACTVCSPTRAALLTGKYPARMHVTDWIPGMMPENPKMLVPDWTKHLPLEETTLAELFKKAGYATASIGKWHLGDEPYSPEQHGFELNIAGTDRPAPPSYHSPWNIPKLPDGPDGAYLTDRLTQEAETWIRSVADRPFFLYLPHFAVHTPIQGRSDLVEKYRQIPRAKLRHQNAQYAAMVEAVDESVGRLRAVLRELDIEDRTAILLLSDNGGRIPTTSNAPLRAGKGSAYEGGTRVPMIIYWPGRTQPMTLCDVPVMTIDIYPTLVELLKLPADPHHIPDGVSLAPLLNGAGHIERDALYWHYPHHQHYQLEGTMPYSAIRSGDYKLLEFYDDNHIELYNLQADISEQHDLSDEHPQLAEALLHRLHSWKEEVGAQLPTLNPEFDPERPQHTPRKKRDR